MDLGPPDLVCTLVRGQCDIEWKRVHSSRISMERMARLRCRKKTGRHAHRGKACRQAFDSRVSVRSAQNLQWHSVPKHVVSHVAARRYRLTCEQAKIASSRDEATEAWGARTHRGARSPRSSRMRSGSVCSVRHVVKLNRTRSRPRKRRDKTTRRLVPRDQDAADGG